MLRLSYVILLALALSACATTQRIDYNNWVQNTLVQAEHGEIKWSEYYQGCFIRLMEEPRGRLHKMEYYNTLLDYSLEYESGRINKLEFDNKRRRLQLEYVRHEELTNATIFVPPSF